MNTKLTSIATTYYLFEEVRGRKQLREVLLDLSDFVQIISVSKEIIRKSLKSSHKDFEDAIQT